MKNLLDSATIEIPCPKCTKKTGETISRLKLVSNLTCRHCRQVFNLDKSELRGEIAKIEKQASKVLGAFGRLGK